MARASPLAGKWFSLKGRKRRWVGVLAKGPGGAL